MPRPSFANSARTATTVAASLALIALPAAARAQSGATIGAQLGAAFPSGDMGASTGYHVGVTLGVRPALSPIGLRAEGTFEQFDNDAGGGSTKVYSVTANLVLGLGTATGGLSPYLIGGGGWYRWDPDRLLSGTQDKLGINGGAGVRFALGDFSTYAEVRYHHVFVDKIGGSRPNISTVPLVFGIEF